MKKVVLLLFCLASLPAFSQFESVDFEQYKIIGKAYSSNIDILSKMTEFNQDIYSVSSDTASDNVLITFWNGEPDVFLSNLQLRAKQMLFDLNESNSLWTKKVNMHGNRVISIDQNLFSNKRNGLYLLDSGTGKYDYHIGKVMQFVWSDSGENWMIFLYRPTKWTWNAYVRKVDLKEKKVLWERDATSKFTWTYLGKLSETKAIFAGDGLHCVNFNDGSGWDYDVETNSFYMDFDPYTHHQENHFSNMVIAEDSMSLYFAAKDRVVKLTEEGELLWETKFDKGFEIGAADLIDNHDNIVFVSKGIINSDVGVLPSVKAYFATLDKNTGEFLHLQEMETKHDKIVDAKVFDNNLFLLVYNGKEKKRCIGKYNLENFNMLAKRSISDIGEEFAYSLGFFNSGVYEKQGDSLVSICATDSTGIYAINGSSVLYFDSKLEKMKTVSIVDLFLFDGECEGLRFFSNMGSTYLTDTNGKLVAELLFSDFFETKSKLIFYNGKKLCEVSKEQLRVLKEKGKAKTLEKK